MFLSSEVTELKQRLQAMESDCKAVEGGIQRREEDLSAAALREKQLHQQIQVSRSV
jgi:hypothetical protein